jgi:hypothetical protein
MVWGHLLSYFFHFHKTQHKIATTQGLLTNDKKITPQDKLLFYINYFYQQFYQAD